MKIVITRDVKVDEVEPGVHLVDSAGDRFVVDEVGKRTDLVRFHGWPAHRNGQGRRSTIEVKPGDPVSVLPDAETTDAVIAALIAAATASPVPGKATVGPDSVAGDGGSPSVLVSFRSGASWRLGFVTEPGDVVHAGPEDEVDGEIVDDPTPESTPGD